MGEARYLRWARWTHGPRVARDVTFAETIEKSKQLDELLASPAAKETTMAEAKPGLFFTLMDEMNASERRLNEKASQLLEEMKQTEELAHKAVQGKRDRLLAARDYIKRMQETTEALNGDNGGPPLGPSNGSQG